MNIIARIRETRRRNSHLTIYAYCEEEDCPTRGVQICVKDYDDELLPLLRRSGGLRCPICGSFLELHEVLTVDEAVEAEKELARLSVAIQMYSRDFETPILPGSIFTENRLPPTPEGWWDK